MGVFRSDQQFSWEVLEKHFLKFKNLLKFENIPLDSHKIDF